MLLRAGVKFFTKLPQSKHDPKEAKVKLFATLLKVVGFYTNVNDGSLEYMFFLKTRSTQRPGS